MITSLDKNTALVLIDLQKGIVGRTLAHPVAGILKQAKLLVEAFHRHKLPVVAVNVDPAGPWLTARKDAAAQTGSAPAPDFTELVEEVGFSAADVFITKAGWNAFYNTGLHETLQKKGVTNIVLGGISTSIGVESTARAASERAYNISFAVDAMTDSVPESHENSLRRIFPRLGELGTAAEIVDALAKRR